MAAALRAALHAPLLPVERERQARDLVEAHTALGDAAFATVWATGQVERLEDTIAEILGAAC